MRGHNTYFQEAELLIERLRRTGPGGQHRNKRETGIRLTHLPTGIVVMATEERSQALNLEHAKQRLVERLRRLSRKHKPRIKTSVPRAVKARRLESKRIHSGTKSLRGRVTDLD